MTSGTGDICKAAKHSVNICSKMLFYFYVYVFILLVIPGTKGCRFPKFLETSAMWVTHNKDGPSNKGYFSGQFLKASRCNGDKCFQYQRKCLAKVGEDKFEVQHTVQSSRNDDPPQYLCMQILKRSESIIQIKESSLLYFRSPKSCSDQHLILDNWPMVTVERFDEQKIPCPFTGGYNIRFHSSDNEPKCATEIIPPRLESECEAGDGMTINFQAESCMDPGLQMTLVQPLFCAGTWTDGNYTFIIVRPQSGEYKSWCMRIKGTDMTRRVEQGEIFLDFVCAPGDGQGIIRETSNYLSIEFEQRIISDTCADSYGFCDDRRLCNQETYSIHCRKFCDYCSFSPSPCVFPGDMRGSWLESYSGKEKSLDVRFYDLRMTGSGQFRCHEKEDHDFTNSTLLLQTFNNGCFPRYACLEVQKVSPSIRAYRIGNRLGWPIKDWDTLKDDVCAESMFKPNAEDVTMFGKGIEDKPMRNLIDTHFHSHVSCELEKFPFFRDNQIYVQSSDECDYCLLYNAQHSDSRLIMQPLNCSSPAHSLERLDYNCLAVFAQDDDNHAVITRALHHHQRYTCWVFVHGDDREERLGTIYLVEASICGSATIEGLRSGTIEPLGKIIVPKEPRTCPYLPDIELQTQPLWTTLPWSRKPVVQHSERPVLTAQPSTKRPWTQTETYYNNNKEPRRWPSQSSSPTTDQLRNNSATIKLAHLCLLFGIILGIFT